jgi:ABC-type glycerol-3-phosphate transport system permease component
MTRRGRIALGAALAVLALASLAPFLWSAITSLRPPADVLAPSLLPRALSLESYADVFRQRPFARYLANSVIVGLLSTALALAAAAPAAAVLARMGRRLAAACETGLLFFALWPPAVLLVPLFTVGRTLGLTNSLAGLAVVHATLNLPFATWMLAAAFRQLPRELEDAARVDGFSRLQYLTRVALPLAGPALGATAILTFIFSWNEFVIALTFLSRDALRTVPVGVAMLTGVTMYEIPWGQISAAVVMTTLPVVVAVLAFQRWIVSGLTAGAVK